MRHFDIDEANEAIATVRPLMERAVAAYRELDTSREGLEALRRSVEGNGGGVAPKRAGELERAAAAASRELAEVMEAVRSLGAEVKDLELGLVDFPALHPDGQTVLLCWRLGEDEIGYWHGLEEGFAGRKPLPF
jgi:hypothetical protein